METKKEKEICVATMSQGKFAVYVEKRGGRDQRKGDRRCKNVQQYVMHSRSSNPVDIERMHGDSRRESFAEAFARAKGLPEILQSGVVRISPARERRHATSWDRRENSRRAEDMK